MIHSVAGVGQAEQGLQLKRLGAEKQREEREKLALASAALEREREQRDSSDELPEALSDKSMFGKTASALGLPSLQERTPSQIAAISALPGVVKGELEKAQQALAGTAPGAAGGTEAEGLTKATVGAAVDVLLRATKDKFDATVRIQKRLADEALQNILTDGGYTAADDPSSAAGKQRAHAGNGSRGPGSAPPHRLSQTGGGGGPRGHGHGHGHHVVMGSALHSLAASREQSQLDLWQSLSAEVPAEGVPPLTPQDEERVESVYTYDLFEENPTWTSFLISQVSRKEEIWTKGLAGARHPLTRLWFHPYRKWTYMTLSYPDYSRLAFAFGTFMLSIILLNTITFCIESVPAVSKPPTPLFDALIIVDYVCMGIFTVEYLARLLTCPSLPRFFLSFSNFIDLVAIAPFYFELIIKGTSTEAFQTRVVRLLRILRVLRIVKSMPRLRHLSIVVDTIKASADVITMLAALLVILLVLFGTVFYFVEPSVFDSIPEAMWYSQVTLTTTGYGDVYPASPLCKTIAGASMLLCMVIVSLPIAVIGGNFSNKWAEYKSFKMAVDRSRDVVPTYLQLKEALVTYERVLDEVMQRVQDEEERMERQLAVMRQEIVNGNVMLRRDSFAQPNKKSKGIFGLVNALKAANSQEGPAGSKSGSFSAAVTARRGGIHPGSAAALALSLGPSTASPDGAAAAADSPCAGAGGGGGLHGHFDDGGVASPSAPKPAFITARTPSARRAAGLAAAASGEYGLPPPLVAAAAEAFAAGGAGNKPRGPLPPRLRFRVAAARVIVEIVHGGLSLEPGAARSAAAAKATAPEQEQAAVAQRGLPMQTSGAGRLQRPPPPEAGAAAAGAGAAAPGTAARGRPGSPRQGAALRLGDDGGFGGAGGSRGGGVEDEAAVAAPAAPPKLLAPAPSMVRFAPVPPPAPPRPPPPAPPPPLPPPPPPLPSFPSTGGGARDSIDVGSPLIKMQLSEEDSGTPAAAARAAATRAAATAAAAATATTKSGEALLPASPPAPRDARASSSTPKAPPAGLLPISAGFAGLDRSGSQHSPAAAAAAAGSPRLSVTGSGSGMASLIATKLRSLIRRGSAALDRSQASGALSSPKVVPRVDPAVVCAAGEAANRAAAAAVVAKDIKVGQMTLAALAELLQADEMPSKLDRLDEQHKLLRCWQDELGPMADRMLKVRDAIDTLAWVLERDLDPDEEPRRYTPEGPEARAAMDEKLRAAAGGPGAAAGGPGAGGSNRGGSVRGGAGAGADAGADAEVDVAADAVAAGGGGGGSGGTGSGAAQRVEVSTLTVTQSGRIQTSTAGGGTGTTGGAGGGVGGHGHGHGHMHSHGPSRLGIQAAGTRAAAAAAAATPASAGAAGAGNTAGAGAGGPQGPAAQSGVEAALPLPAGYELGLQAAAAAALGAPSPTPGAEEQA
ncbi:hypothetical protein HYH02_008087 [Chlamydomonas schloesseri]|uniref:Ion transport domain-containing protein n=1 Tax=Chlamydomonas schloesseri TaxID=2026947 RepID=A0A836B3Z5_9CHLO|nr:hypothetical protein HYH02_008087 [Chlamydomonas schloesseri]|eukprot:KAG2446932.1 hypothetical protein HYH02_008087 [Chlamydomonas schloesseri]